MLCQPLFGVSRPPCCATPSPVVRRAYAHTNSTACYDNNEKINSWASFSFPWVRGSAWEPSGRRSSAIKILVHSTKEKFKPTDLIASYIWFDFWFYCHIYDTPNARMNNKASESYLAAKSCQRATDWSARSVYHVAAAWQILGYSFRKSVN